MNIKNKTAGHAGIACFSFALKGNRAGSPHFKIVRFKWWEHVTKQGSGVLMADLDYKKENMKELHAPDKKVKEGVYVIAALLVLVYLLPIYVMLNQSFRFMTDLSPRLYLPEKWTLDNYIQAFQNADLWKGMKNSFVYVVEVCILEIVLGGLAAYGLARAGGKISNALRTVNICIMMKRMKE